MSELVWIEMQLRLILCIPALCQLLVGSSGWVTLCTASRSTDCLLAHCFQSSASGIVEADTFFSKIYQAAALLSEVKIDYNK